MVIGKLVDTAYQLGARSQKAFLDLYKKVASFAPCRLASNDSFLSRKVMFAVVSSLFVSTAYANSGCGPGGIDPRSKNEFVQGVFESANKLEVRPDKIKDWAVDLSNPKRRGHILHGDATGGGHLFPGKPGKSVFPKEWGGDKVMHEISDIATDLKIDWQKGRVIKGNQRWEATGVRDGVEIKVIIEPNGEGIISAFPLSGRGVIKNPK